MTDVLSNYSDFKQPFCPVIHTSHWTRQCARQISPRPENTIPAFDTYKIKSLMPGYHVWDSWFALTEEGQVAKIDGFIVLFALVRPLTETDERMNPYHPRLKDPRERIAYFYSDDGVHYHVGGFLFATPVYEDIREWSGSTILRDDGRLQTFYTIARGQIISGVWQTEQRLATAIQTMEVVTGRSGRALVVSSTDYHALLKEPDGLLYENAQQSAEREEMYATRHRAASGDDQLDNFCFRDPKFIKDPETGRTYLLFEANTGPAFCPAGSVRRAFIGNKDYHKDYIPTPDDLKANGCVGVLELTNADYTYGSFCHPWLTSNLVTDEIERINVIWHQDHVYLFVVAHGDKCTLLSHQPDLMNRDFMLGFRAKSLFAELEPMNGSGVVLQQKSLGPFYSGQEENKQYVYSWLIVPGLHEGELDCISYANYSTDLKGECQPVKSAGPILTLQIEGLDSRIVDQRYGILPADEQDHAEKSTASA